MPDFKQSMCPMWAMCLNKIYVFKQNLVSLFMCLLVGQLLYFLRQALQRVFAVKKARIFGGAQHLARLFIVGQQFGLPVGHRGSAAAAEKDGFGARKSISGHQGDTARADTPQR